MKRTNKHLFISFFTILIAALCSCTKPNKTVEYIDGKQILNMNGVTAFGQRLESIDLKVLSPELILIGERAVFKVVSSNPNYKLVNGLFDCDLTEHSVIDTTLFKVDSCVKGFVVKNDTLYVAFKPRTVRKKKFNEIIVGISRDKDGVFRYHMGTFEYEVVEWK